MRWIALLALGQMAGVVQAAEVFRSVTEDGSVVYGDRPFSATVDVIHVTVAEQPGTAVPLTVAPVRQSVGAGIAPTPANAAADEMTNDQIRRRIAENCEIAKNQLAVVESTDDLVRSAADGTMERLTAEEIVEIRALAAAEVDEWCESAPAAGDTR